MNVRLYSASFSRLLASPSLRSSYVKNSQQGIQFAYQLNPLLSLKLAGIS